MSHGYDRDAISKRLRRIEGQVRGLQRMVEDDRYCADIMTQIASVQQALRSVGRALMQNHLRHCATEAFRSGDPARGFAHAWDAVPEEVEKYEDDMLRRLNVMPGMTGLWQVSGRSDLSWEDTVRLDLYYVDNWSMVQDLLILARTVTAVLASRGAY